MIPMPADAYGANRKSEDDMEEFAWLLGGRGNRK
jgi:hypothetical protein